MKTHRLLLSLSLLLSVVLAVAAQPKTYGTFAGTGTDLEQLDADSLGGGIIPNARFPIYFPVPTNAPALGKLYQATSATSAKWDDSPDNYKTNLYTIPASAFTPLVTSGAEAVTLETATYKVVKPVLAFDGGATEEGAGIWITSPPYWDEAILHYRMNWTATNGSGTVGWSVAARLYAHDDAIDQAMGTAGVVAAQTLTAAGDVMLTGWTALTPAGTLRTNAPVYIEVRRDTSEDSLSDDAHLIQMDLLWGPKGI